MGAQGICFVLAAALLCPNAHSGWVKTNGPYGGYICTFAVSGGNLFAGTEGGGIFLSCNNGSSWIAVNTGLPSTYIRSLAMSGANLFAGTCVSGVWRRPLSEMLTSVEPLTSDLPHAFVLGQNYPNPCNPSTTIRYGLPASSQVTLTVFITLGQEVGQLINWEMDAGFHEVKFDASGLASGVYLYRMQSGSYVETRKLLLVR